VSGAFFGGLIFLLGIGLLSTEVLTERIPKPNRTYLGIVFLVYGIYRGYRAKLHYDRLKREKEPQ
jgi:hypothetical protein